MAFRMGSRNHKESRWNQTSWPFTVVARRPRVIRGYTDGRQIQGCGAVGSGAQSGELTGCSNRLPPALLIGRTAPMRVVSLFCRGDDVPRSGQCVRGSRDWSAGDRAARAAGSGFAGHVPPRPPPRAELRATAGGIPRLSGRRAVHLRVDPLRDRSPWSVRPFHAIVDSSAVDDTDGMEKKGGTLCGVIRCAHVRVLCG